MKKESVEILEAHLPSILECCFFENPTTRKISTDFIDYVLGDRKLEDYVREKLSDYSSLSYQMKIKVILHILASMFEKKEEGRGDYQMKQYFDCLSRKVNLVYSLFIYHLKVPF